MTALRTGLRRSRRPALYLDIDDTILTYASGTPRAAPGAAEFLDWALRTFEVRWLTRWCPNGRMAASLIEDLCEMTGLDSRRARSICGFDWQVSHSKLDGIAWLEHVVLDRPFLWIEDEYGVGTFELRFLARHGFRDSYVHCNVTRDPDALIRLHARLRDR